MQIIKDIETFQAYRTALFGTGNMIGLVPTMGALHEGHLALVEKAMETCDKVIVTIFVNPAQFNHKEDLDSYPRTVKEDLNMLTQFEVDAIFIPELDEVYPDDPTISFHLGKMADSLEGHYRPGHFSGVALIVAKLFNIVQPNKAFFGQKDLQQLQIIKQMVRELSYPIEIVAVSTVRDQEGLALSSRNQRLSTKGIQIARNISTILEKGAELLRKRENPNVILQLLRDQSKDTEGLDLEYLEIVDPKVMQPVQNYKDLPNVAICVAAYVEETRLIDNIMISLD